VVAGGYGAGGRLLSSALVWDARGDAWHVLVPAAAASGSSTGSSHDEDFLVAAMRRFGRRLLAGLQC